MFSSFAFPMAKVSPFRIYQAKSLFDDLSCSTFSIFPNVDISVPHLISPNPSGSERGLACPEKPAQPIRKMLNAMAKTFPVFIAPAFDVCIFVSLLAHVS